MSAERPQREVAHRLFAAEFEDSEYTYAESDEERAPNYVVTPTGARVNRLFVVGVLTEVEAVSDGVLRARVVDPTGAFVVYAGQYQPEALAFFERTDPPAFVAVTGKARTFQPDDADVIYTSIRPESANEVTVETRDRWVVQTAERTIDRVETFAGALDLSERGDALEDALRRRGVDASLAAGIPKAIEFYGTTSGYLAGIREMALDATRVVADELDEVERPTLAPDEGEDAPLEFDYSLPEPAVEAQDEAPSTPAEEESGEPSATDEDTGESPDSEEEAAEAADGEPVEETGEAADSESAGETAESTDDEPAETATSAEATEPGEADVAPGDPDEMYDLSESEREEVKSEFGVDFETGNEVSEPGEAGIETPEPDDADAESSEAGDADPETPEPDQAEGSASGAASKSAGSSVDETEELAATDEPSDELDESVPAEDGTKETEESEAEVGGETGDETESEVEAETGDEAGTDEEGETEDEEGETEDEETDEPTDVDLEDAVVEVMGELDDGDGAPRSELVETVADRHDVGDEAVEDAIQDALMGGRCYEPAEDRLTPI